jgi:ubiquinone/menaquinone biosynthesis C-methylase UbiE
MQRLLAAGGTIRDALEEQVRPCDAALADYLRGYALDGRRAAWKYLAGAAPGGRALDFGCGWGALSISLADSYREVYAADAIPERVAVALRNAREHGVANVRGCVASGWPRLPFPDGFFSLVVLNGVLEWLPAGIPGRPEAVQVAFLREVVRVLEPAGQLYVGIENRFGLPYFAGRREEHTRLRFISLLPRPVARLYHRLRKGTEYRAYTFGLSQLERRLQRAGFAGTSAYAPFPDYRDFYLMLRLDDPRWFEHGFRPQSLPGRIASLLLRGLPPLRSLLPSLGLFASPARLPPSRLDRLVAHLKQSGAIPAELTPTSYRVSPTGTIQVKLSDGRARLLLSLPQDPGGRERMRRSVLLREALSRLASGSRLSQMLDAPVAGVQEGLYYKLDTYYDHPRAARYVRAHPWREAEVLDRSLEWLGLLHSTATSRVPFALEEFGRSGLRLALRALPGSAGAELEGWCRRAEGLPVRVSPVHGDFHLRNVLVVGDAAIARVIDWDMAELQGLPLWDVLTLWHSVRFERGEPWAAAYAAVAERVLRIRELGDAERRYADSLALTDLDCWAAVLTFPLLQLEHKAWAGQSDNHVILEGIAAPLGALARRATAALGGDAPCA